MSSREGHLFIPTLCARCGATLKASTVSIFNTEWICLDCKDDEKLAPGYATAVAIEAAAVRAKNYNFPGVGLAPSDNAFLAVRRLARRALAAKP